MYLYRSRSRCTHTSVQIQWRLRSTPDKMTNVGILLQGVLAALATTVVHGKGQVPLPPIDLNKWWGPGSRPAVEDKSIKPFKIEFKPSMIRDLKRRLVHTRPFTPPLEGITAEYGINADIHELWRQFILNDYPFIERVPHLNKYNHYTTRIQGLKIHFARATADTTNTTITQLTALMILHGHPGSVIEFYESIPYILSMGLSHGIAFDIIMPTIPGYTFSEAPARTGCGVDQVAIMYRNLVHRLGHTKFIVQGGDMGSIIANCMATFFPKECDGHHSNFPLFHTPKIVTSMLYGNFYKEEVADKQFWPRLYPSLDRLIWVIWRTGYLHLQSTKPDTFGIYLADSPMGHLAHLLRTNGPPNNTESVSAVKIIDNWMLYWSTNSYPTAIRLYAETFNKRYVNLRINEITTPIPFWVLQTPDEMVYIPGWMLKDKFPNLLGETLPLKGGHFYAWENPKEFAVDVVKACVAFKKFHAKNDALREFEKCCNSPKGCCVSSKERKSSDKKNNQSDNYVTHWVKTIFKF